MENPLVRLEPGLFVWTIVTFLVLLAVLKRFVWKPMVDALDRRSERIRKALEEAEASRQRLEQVNQESEAILAKARGQAQEVLASGKAAAERMRDQLVAEAKERSAAMVHAAEQQIASEKNKAIGELKSEVAALTLQVASRLLQRTVTLEDHSRLIEEALKEAGPRGEA